jgi:hypothetical protein
MKRVLISIVLATVFASIPVFAETCEIAERTVGAAVAALASRGRPASPQYRRRYRRRYVIVRRRRHYRRRHYRRIYVIRHRRRRY